ncbi:hypothetical protein GTY65_27490 [Streptomyces sp. SID8379]|uniref:hypothetical protein n=1 Tax=unclassified Streptomyces TaxID=2593676 RepID=UPI00037D66A0|nr:MULTISPECIES: hypothetical protein [unclassified Streptomyces]MYW67788.1 hypothetical protein [Streptomyces sp. SID8379]
MPSFLDKAAESDEEIRSTQEKDPADLSGAQEPDWDNPDAWSGSTESASNSASENADRTAPPKSKKPKAPASKSKAAATRTPALRRGRPKGPDRKPLSTRILPELDRMLTKAVEETGKNPQTLVEEALAMYFRRLKIEDPGPGEGSTAA